MMRRAFSLAAALMLGAAMPNMAHAAPDNTLGTALLSARIADDGAVIGSSGLEFVSHTAAGHYALVFGRRFGDCQPVATPISSNVAVTVRIAAIVDAANQSSLGLVFNRISDGAQIDTAFSVVVFCPK